MAIILRNLSNYESLLMILMGTYETKAYIRSYEFVFSLKKIHVLPYDLRNLILRSVLMN